MSPAAASVPEPVEAPFATPSFGRVVDLEAGIETGALSGLGRAESEPAALPESKVAGRSGWLPGEASGEPGRGKPVGVGKTPVSVDVGNAGGKNVDAVTVRVLDQDLADGLSPYGAVAAIDFLDVRGGSVDAGNVKLTLSFADVNLSDVGSSVERLTVTVFSGCEVFETVLSEEDLKVVEGLDDEVAAAIGDEVVCDWSARLDGVVDIEAETITVELSRSELAKLENERRKALKATGVKDADLDPKRGRERAEEASQGRISFGKENGNGNGKPEDTGKPDDTGKPEDDAKGNNGKAVGQTTDTDTDTDTDADAEPEAEIETDVTEAEGVESDVDAGVALGRARSVSDALFAASPVSFPTPAAKSASASASSFVFQSTGSPILVGLSSSAASSGGDFSALPVPTLTDAQVGLYTGSAELSYPLPVPAAAAGPSPSVSLVYSSAGVDGRTMGTNNQSSSVGVGWSLSAGGSINRSLKACNEAAAQGDRCISSAPDESYSLSLAGRSSQLVRVDGGSSSSYPKEFRLASDPSWRVRLNKGGSVNGATVSTKDHLNEWWSVETPDGTVYTLGTTSSSVDWMPVWYPSGGCSATYALCDTARAWNLDTVTDASGNQMTYTWGQESNWYNARQISTAYKREYVRASRVESVTYGANPGLGRPANAQIVLDYEWRCGSSSDFGNCSWPNDFKDTPNDLWCGPNATDEYTTTCSENAATFWSHLRFTGALSQVTDGAGGWVTVAHHDPFMTFARDPTATDSTQTPYDEIDSEWQAWISKVQERPVSDDGDSFARNAFNPLMAAEWDGASGVAFNTAAHDVGSENAAGSLNGGNWVLFEDVWFGNDTEATEVTFRYAAHRTGSFQIRLDSISNPVHASFTVQTGGVYDFKTHNMAIPAVTGVHDVYIRAHRTKNSKTFATLQSVQFGRDTQLNLEEVAEAGFGTPVYMDNRLNHPAGVSAMRFPRIQTFENQLGGTISFAYGHSPGQACSTGTVYNFANHTLDCFPQWDTSSTPNGWTVFNKWPVTQSTRTGQVSAVGANAYTPDVVTNYDYDSAGWGFADNPDSSSDTWNEFRGYNKVTVTDATGAKTEHSFHQGLHGEPTSGSGTATHNVVRSDGTTIQDHYALRGMTYETRRLAPNGTVLSKNWTEYYNDPSTSLTGRDDPRIVAADDSYSWVQGGAETRTLMQSFNSWGSPAVIKNLGDPNVSGDETTTVTQFYFDNTSATLGAWRAAMPCVVATPTNAASTATPYAHTATGKARQTRTEYDNVVGVDYKACRRSVDVPVPTAQVSYTANTAISKTTFTVDNRGRVTTVKDPEGNNTTTTYDNTHGYVTSSKNALNWTSTVGYDAWTRPTSSTDVNGRTTSTVFDEYGRVTQIKLPVDGGTPSTKVTYNQDARPAYVQVESRLNGNDYSKTVSFVDGFGANVLTRTLAPETGKNWVAAVGHDNLGRTQRSSAQYAINNDNITTFEYPAWSTVDTYVEQTFDNLSRPYDTHTKSNGNTEFTTKTRYNGFVTSTYDQKNQRTDTTVDGLGRTTEIKENAANNITTSYTYNTAGDLLNVNGPDNSVTSIVYDKAGRKTSMSDPDTGDFTYTYDLASNLTSQTDASGSVTTFSYDDLHRRTWRRENGAWRGYLRYDPAGNLGAQWETRQYNADGTISWTRDYFDTYGRTTQTQSFIPDASGGTTTKRFVTKYSNYRADGQPSTIQYPTSAWYETGEQVDYTFNNRTGQQQTLTSSTQGVLVDGVTLNDAGQMTQMLYGPSGNNGVKTNVYSTTNQRLLNTTAGTTADTDVWQSFAYTYDNNANITRIVDATNANQVQCFTYDALDRLTSGFTDNTTTCNGHTPTGDGNYDETYTFNAAGDITSKTGQGTYTYNDPDHVHAVTSTSTGSVFTYNDDGDMVTRKTGNGPTQTLTWNMEERLETVTENGTTSTYLYAENGARTRTNTDNDYTYYHGNTEYRHNTSTNTSLWTYAHTFAGQTVAVTVDGDTSWLFADQIGSNSLAVTETGAVSVQRYTPWGEIRVDGGLPTQRGYTGQIEDENTGLSYYNARYYDPTIGRFISPDTIIPNPSNGQDYNRYAYVNNRPIIANDPTGHDPCLDGGGGCGGVRGINQGDWNINTGRRDSLDADGDGIVCGGGFTNGCEDPWEPQVPRGSSPVWVNPYERARASHALSQHQITLANLEDGFITARLLELIYNQEGGYVRMHLEGVAVWAGRESYGPMSLRWEQGFGDEADFATASRDLETALGWAALKLEDRLQYVTATDPIDAERQLFLAYSLGDAKNLVSLAGADWDISRAEANGLGAGTASKLRQREQYYIYWASE